MHIVDETDASTVFSFVQLASMLVASVNMRYSTHKTGSVCVLDVLVAVFSQSARHWTFVRYIGNLQFYHNTHVGNNNVIAWPSIRIPCGSRPPEDALKLVRRSSVMAQVLRLLLVKLFQFRFRPLAFSQPTRMQ